MRTVKLLLLLPIGLLLLTPVHSTTPTLATGTITASDLTLTVVRVAGGNTFYNASIVDAFTGGIQGELVATGNLRVTSTGNLTFIASGTFTGTVGASELGTDVFHSQCAGTGFRQGALVSILCHEVLVGGTGGLAGLH